MPEAPSDPTFVSLLPPVVAIGLALLTRQVYVSLIAGLTLGWILVAGGHPFEGLALAVDGVVAVLGKASSARVLLFSLLIGALVVYIEASGGVRGFVQWIEEKKLVRSPRGAAMLAWVLGIVVFIESNITLLVTGAVCRPLFDRYGTAREKLAYLADSTSAPVCILLPFNAWGAMVLGILGGIGIASPTSLFIESIPLNLYALAAALLAGLTAWRGWNLGPMRTAQARVGSGATEHHNLDEELMSTRLSREAPPRARNMVLPILVLILAMPTGLYVTGDGSLADGSGSTSALWAILAANGAAAALILMQRLASIDETVQLGIRGCESLLGLVLVLLLAMALGGVCQQLGTGPYVAASVRGLDTPALLLPAAFWVSAAVAFATGTSWGTFAIMIPITVPAAQSLGLPPAPFLAAALSGGVFGDHTSPISDTTIVASLASATDVVEHVRTQLPYALIAGGVATLGFAIMGAVLG
jgi:Na+/H+ antiporter NhaC